jgi:[acyl-carrier-protein] S-malonyltransferase
MIDRAIALSPSLGESIVERASRILGRDLRSLRLARPIAEERPETNRDVQVGVFLASHLHMVAIESEGLDAPRSLGLSLGEYNHLVHIGALTFEDALRLVDARGDAYDGGPDGAMAVVFPLELEELRGVVEEARVLGSLEIGNYNSPTQHVLSGERVAIEAALAILEAEHFVHGRIIEPNLPMHSSTFAPVAERFRRVIETAPFRVPAKPYTPNVMGESVTRPSPRFIQDKLIEHVHRSVHWHLSIERISADVPDAVFIEVGPGTVLSNLSKRAGRHAKYNTDGPSGMTQVIELLRGKAARAS